jgi:molybdopterin synthase sulfur carrier subunit
MIFRLSGSLRRFVDYRREVQCQAPTAQAAIDSLVTQYPGLKSALLDRKGRVRTAHRLFLNGDQMDRSGGDVPVASQDTIEIVTAIAGG